MQDWKGYSVNLQMIPKWEELLTPWKAGRPCREAFTNQGDSWAMTSHMKFNKRKCWMFHLGWSSPGCMDRLGDEMLKSRAVGRDMEVLVDGKLTFSLGDTSHSITNQPRERIIPLWSALGWPHLKCWGQF